MSRSRVRVQISVPTGGSVRFAFARSLATLVGRVTGEGLPRSGLRELEIRLAECTSTNWINNRERLVKQALAQEMTHVMFLDDDHEFDSGVLDLMMSRGKPIVVTNYLVKRAECDKFAAHGLDGETVPTLATSTGLQEVAFSGFGVSLIATKVFRDVPQPWFLPRFVEETCEYTTEDTPFFERARERGYAVWLDHDASKMVTGHFGGRSWHWSEYRRAA